MKTHLLILSFILFISCQTSSNKNTSTKRLEKGELQKLLDSKDVGGTILIYDEAKNTFYTNDFEEAEKEYLPASTYKIPHSIIGLELGILEDENIIFKWNGEERMLPVWEQNLSLKDAFQYSCVPCYQEMAREIGINRMQENIEKLDFGKMVITEETIDNFWLIGESVISPFEQIDFLHRLKHGELPISYSTQQTLLSILNIESNEDYTLRGKTGLAINGEYDVGWFVGYLEKDNQTFYLATKLIRNSDKVSRREFQNLRQFVTEEALVMLEYM